MDIEVIDRGMRVTYDLLDPKTEMMPKAEGNISVGRSNISYVVHIPVSHCLIYMYPSLQIQV